MRRFASIIGILALVMAWSVYGWELVLIISASLWANNMTLVSNGINLPKDETGVKNDS